MVLLSVRIAISFPRPKTQVYLAYAKKNLVFPCLNMLHFVIEVPRWTNNFPNIREDEHKLLASTVAISVTCSRPRAWPVDCTVRKCKSPFSSLVGGQVSISTKRTQSG
jgi:hypothetical protein